MPAFFAIITTVLIFFTSTAFAGFSAELCKSPQYTCHVSKRGDTWAKLFPDTEQRDLVMRINRMNTRLYSGIKIAIPNDLSTATLLEFAPFPKQIEALGKKSIVVSLDKLAFGAYDAEGNLQHWGPVSGGKSYCSDLGRGCRTKSGSFTIYSKGSSSCVSSKFPLGKGGAPMPYCMFFHGGFALHGSPEVPGYNASHGCVRMFTQDAKWLNQDFTAGERSVAVVVNQ